jgi:predicted TIM-barrel fold metal-dependent hydrolase
MSFCPYVYCRSPLEAGRSDCGVCGHPGDDAELMHPAFLAQARVEGLPETLLDMHQILPAREGMLEVQLLAMQRFGIARALLQSAPDQAHSLYGNQKLLELASQRPETFWISQFLDPRMPDAISILDRLAAEGVRVVKLLPPAGFRLDDPAHDPFLRRMEELGLVAMVHTGFITARHKQEEARAGAFLSSVHASPLSLDQPARKFPRLTFILCHLGGAVWHEQGAQMVTQHDNVWGDVSGFGLFALQRLLRNRAAVDWGKVFWGNDSAPFAYPLNLRLLLACLSREGAESLGPGLLFENGRRFADRFLT